jgi:hypothetical protein
MDNLKSTLASVESNTYTNIYERIRCGEWTMSADCKWKWSAEQKKSEENQDKYACNFVQKFIFVIVFVHFTINHFRFYSTFVFFKSIVIVFFEEVQSFSFSLTKIALVALCTGLWFYNQHLSHWKTNFFKERTWK